MTAPRVSVITVVFNAGELLAQTIEAVAALDPPAFEHVVIDGSSTDPRTCEILRQKRGQIAKLVSEPDAGIYDAMNKGLRLAEGDFVWFLNAGDTPAAPDVLCGLANDAADVYYGHTRLVDDAGREVKLAQAPARLEWRAMTVGMRVSHQSILVRRALAPAYDLAYPCIADQKWIVDSLRRACTVRHAERPMSNYLLGGLSQRQYGRFVREKLRYAFAELGWPRASWVTLHALLQLARHHAGRLLRRIGPA